MSTVIQTLRRRIFTLAVVPIGATTHSRLQHHQHQVRSMSTNPAPALFSPIQVGDIKLGHRVVLAPLTRYRASDAHVPTDLVVEYYKQRASVPGTLLISEATFISPESSGMPNAPGIWNDAQIAAWKKVRRFKFIPPQPRLMLH